MEDINLLINTETLKLDFLEDPKNNDNQNNNFVIDLTGTNEIINPHKMKTTIEVYPNGRKRVTNACNNCKERHSKCGFEKPCRRCKQLGLDCTESPVLKRGIRKKNKNRENRVTNIFSNLQFHDYSYIFNTVPTFSTEEIEMVLNANYQPETNGKNI